MSAAVSAIKWPEPVCSDPQSAISDLVCVIERLRTIQEAAVDLLGNTVVPYIPPEGPAWSAAHSAFCMIRLVHDDLEAVERQLDAVEISIMAERKAVRS